MLASVDRYILPAHASRNDSQWFPPDFIVFVHHQETRRSSFRSQCLLSMLYSPFQLLGSNKYLPQRGVHFGLARVKTCSGSYAFLVVQDEPRCTPPHQSVSLGLCHCSTTYSTYLSRVLSTLFRCVNVVLAHAFCASAAFAIARSIPSGVDGFTKPSSRPLAGQ